MVAGRFLKTNSAAQRHIRTSTLKAESRGECIDRRSQQSGQDVPLFGRFRLPGCDEVAARPEFAERPGLFFFVWYHFSLIRWLSKILRICLVANVLSAVCANLPKQKPNKNKPFQDFFFPFDFLFWKQEKYGTTGGKFRRPGRQRHWLHVLDSSKIFTRKRNICVKIKYMIRES